jgi:hypothetical protein
MSVNKRSRFTVKQRTGHMNCFFPRGNLKAQSKTPARSVETAAGVP